jgi:hypothetical protein
VSLRKLAGLFAAFGLTLGLVGTGVGAQFTSSVTGQETVNVGTFGCSIIHAGAGLSTTDLDGNIVGGTSVTYTAPTILSSAPGSAPFNFTVHNTGTIAAYLTVTTTPLSLSSPWSYITPTYTPVTMPVAAGSDVVVGTGVQWIELQNADRGATGTVQWTVTCHDQP